MGWIINKIRQWFCVHDWELLNKTTMYADTDYWGRTVEPYNVGIKWTYRCKKCGKMNIVKNY